MKKKCNKGYTGVFCKVTQLENPLKKEQTVDISLIAKLNALSLYALIVDDVSLISPNLVKLYPEIINILFVK